MARSGRPRHKTKRLENSPRVLVFIDILGFEQTTREIRVRAVTSSTKQLSRSNMVRVKTLTGPARRCSGPGRPGWSAAAAHPP